LLTFVPVDLIEYYTCIKESPLQARQGKLLAKAARTAAARRGLKEAEGKTLPRQTETAQEAYSPGEKAILFKAQYLYGRSVCKYGGDKREGPCSMLPEL